MPREWENRLLAELRPPGLAAMTDWLHLNAFAAVEMGTESARLLQLQLQPLLLLLPPLPRHRHVEMRSSCGGRPSI